MTNKLPEASNKVEEAKEELKNAVNCWDYCGKWPSPDSEEYYLFESSKNLLNALDAQEEMSQLVADKTDKC